MSYLSTGEFCKQAGISLSTCKRWISSNKVRWEMQEGKYLIKSESVDDFKDKLRVKLAFYIDENQKLKKRINNLEKLMMEYDNANGRAKNNRTRKA